VTRLQSGTTDTRLSIPARDNIFSCLSSAQHGPGNHLPLQGVRDVYLGLRTHSTSSSVSTMCSVGPGTQLPLNRVPCVQSGPELISS
jgi:hypothetical protein